ncbi:hypothetical protein LJC48_03545 [Desulfovibrio sp. OttesenSCG-928-C06]|nr:hypothetical protein [Desulfovibrio sp. OttesenSCG-928-C06]
MPKRAAFFDAKDYELLRMVNMILERDRTEPAKYAEKLLDPDLHPHGIKELALSYDKRIAYAVIDLLESLEAGLAEDRLIALENLYDEVMYGTMTNFRYNTGRVLVQIMKEVVRAHGNFDLQLRLAHDFRMVTSGRRRVVRALLRRYHLLEMPEEWNQQAFDDHVHDANTKGRKSPTHLVMDAWIKGLRSIKVIYYNFVRPSSAQELMRAAAIMRMQVRIGVEFKTRFRGRYVDIIWQPTDFVDHHELTAFLNESEPTRLMSLGQAASRYNDQYVFSLLEAYNATHRVDIGNRFGVTLPSISREEFLSYVGTGQPAILHLAELVYNHAQPHVARRFAEVRAALDSGRGDKTELETLQGRIKSFSTEEIEAIWLSREFNSDLPDPAIPRDTPDVPEILRLSTKEMVEWLTRIRASSRITLNLPGLSVDDVLEIIYDCQGKITHLELLNLKYFRPDATKDLEAINQLQLAVNSGRPIALKRVILGIIHDLSVQNADPLDSRVTKFREILRDLNRLRSFYRVSKLRSAIGSDSTSRSNRKLGMGFVWIDTLPARARRAIKKDIAEQRAIRQTLPLYAETNFQVTVLPQRYQTGTLLGRLIARVPLLRRLNNYRRKTWVVFPELAHLSKQGNLSTLGGIQTEQVDSHGRRMHEEHVTGPLHNYINTTLLNTLKVLVGFTAAMLTFRYTQSWWVLVWLGAPIWFFITGFRNIMQAVLGSGGLRRSPLLRWNNYVSRSRLCDSLLYTGLSVPLLELGARHFLLEGALRLNPTENSLIFFGIMSLINGAYIVSHNIFRGLPTGAVVGNVFRSVLAIPCAILYSQIFSLIVALFSPAPELIVLQFSTIISKTASDTVAGIIEGIAERGVNIRIRINDYQAKMGHLFDCFSRLEMQYPEETSVLRKLAEPREGPEHGSGISDCEKAIIIDSLDLLYFWMYQPRARSALQYLMPRMTREERNIFCRAQFVLTREREVSQLVVDGAIGRNFAKPLSFYLAQSRGYLKEIMVLAGIKVPLPGEDESF